MGANLDTIRLQTDFKYFCKWSGPDPITGNEILITPEHLRLIKLLMGGKDYVVVAYRGFGKSTAVSHKYLIRRTTQHGKSAVIFSATEDLAVEKLRSIKTAFEIDPHLNRFCGKGIFTRTDKEIWITDKENVRYSDDGKEIYPMVARIKALGFDSKFRGLHFDIIDCDDIVVEHNTLTPEGSPDITKITQTKELFNAKVVPLRNPGGNIILVGTPQYWNPQDIKNSDLLYDWVNKKGKEAYILPALNEMDEPTCPELHNKEFLDEQRNSMSEESWMKEYMLNPKIAGDTIMNEDILIRCLNDRATYVSDYVPRLNEVVFIGTDYAVIDNKYEAEKKNSCYFAMVAVCYDIETQKRRLLNIHYERGISFSEQIQKTMTWIRRYGARVLCMESHGGMRYFMSELAQIVPSGTSIEDASNKASKFDTYQGLPSLQYLFEKELIELPNRDISDQEKNKFLLHEFKYMKSSSHVDVIDALLRVETIIRLNYSIGMHDPNFSLRKINRDQYNPTDLDKESLRVFGDYNKKEMEDLVKEKTQEQLSKVRTIPEENLKIILERTR